MALEAHSAAETAGEVMTDYLSAQLAQLRIEEPLVLAGAPDAVHKMRVAARRARSALATYAPLLAPGSGEELSDELRWLGAVLGEARDAEVLRSRIDEMLAEEPASVGRSSASQRIDSQLDTREAQGAADARALLDSDRYHRLLRRLDQFVLAPPFTARAGRAASDEVTDLVVRDWKRLETRVRRAAATSVGEERDLALHSVRKAAKRLRYAAESAVPVLGSRAERLAASATTVQDVLGDHHDSAVVRALLREVLSASGHGDAVLDRLRAREQRRADAVEKDYERALVFLMRDHPGRWLRRE